MADNSTLPVSVGTEVFANYDLAGVKYPRVKITWGPTSGTPNDTDIASGKPLPVQLRNSAGQLLSDTTGVLISTTQLAALNTVVAAMAAGYQLVGIPSDQVWGVGATGFTKLEDAASADGDKGIPAMAIQQATPADTAGTNADYAMLQMSGGYLWVHDNKGLANKAFSAAFSTLTRQANTTAYSAGDSISDNATAASVTALTATISDVNDDPIFISEILVTSTDTGLAGKRIRAYLYNSDPTASSGVVGGDNLAFSNKKAGYIGSMSGRMEAGFSDGTPGRLVPSFQLAADTTDLAGAPASGFIVTKPTSGAKTLFIQFQAIDAFTPSANSTTIIATIRGWQARAV